MRIFRMILQVGVFLFLAGYFLMLVTGIKLDIPEFPASPSPTVQKEGFKPKMSPIERMRGDGIPAHF